MKRSMLGGLCAALVLLSGCALFQSGILYEETWSDPNTTAWTIGNTDYANKWIEGGRYHVLVKQATSVLYWNASEGPFGNTQIDIDVRHEAGTDNLSTGGVLFRVTDINNAYAFEVSPAGTYRIGKWVANVWTAIVAWTPSPAIHTGTGDNHLTVMADGTALTFLVNQTQVTELTDSSLPSGRVGVIVTAFSNDVDVHESFDNLVVRELK
jgi:hypothetical protein